MRIYRVVVHVRERHFQHMGYEASKYRIRPERYLVIAMEQLLYTPSGYDWRWEERHGAAIRFGKPSHGEKALSLSLLVKQDFVRKLTGAPCPLQSCVVRDVRSLAGISMHTMATLNEFGFELRSEAVELERMLWNA